MTTGGEEYIGTENKTEGRIACQAWTSQFPHEHEYANNQLFFTPTVIEHHNYCRSPFVGQDWQSTAPWCYTQDPQVRWQFCDIPPCGKHFVA